jgi:beta-phosphoglucomutase
MINYKENCQILEAFPIMNKKLEAVIFDLDGVIVNTSKYHFMAWQKMAKKIGIRIDKDFEKHLKGIGRAKSLEKILEFHGKECPTGVKKELMIQKNKYYLDYIDNIERDALLPGAMQCLELLKFLNVKTVLASMSKNTKKVTDKLEIDQYFNFIIDSKNIKESKPDPEIFIKAANSVGVSYEGCIGIEDSVAGLEAINKCKMVSIGVGDPKELFMADINIKDLSEFDIKAVCCYGGFNA